MKREDAKVGMRVRYAPTRKPDYALPVDVTTGTILDWQDSWLGPLVQFGAGPAVFVYWESLQPECADGWIQWHGGECPVAPDTEVEVRLRGGGVDTGHGDDWRWCNLWRRNGDIVAYRVVATGNPSIVALLDDNGTPKPARFPHVHASRSAAIAEAERLAVRHNGSTFGVYELVARSTAPAVQTEVL